MTEFEEDLKNKIDSEQVPMYITQDRCSMTRKTYIETNWLLDTYSNWRSDEHVQKLLELGDSYVIANQNLVHENKKLKQEMLTDLKSELDQRELLVVPECVAEFITKIKKAHNNLSFAFNSKFNECPAEYWNEAIVWRLNNHDEFVRAWLDGYQVEKPKLFYLKNKLTDMYLYKKPLGGYGEEPTDSIKDLTDDFKFTQREIDKMDAQGYDKEDKYKGE